MKHHEQCSNAFCTGECNATRPTAKEEAAPGGVGDGRAVDVIAYGPVDGTGERHPEGSYIMLHVSKGNAHDFIRISKGAASVLAAELIGIAALNPPASVGVSEAMVKAACAAYDASMYKDEPNYCASYVAMHGALTAALQAGPVAEPVASSNEKVRAELHNAFQSGYEAARLHFRLVGDLPAPPAAPITVDAQDAARLRHCVSVMRAVGALCEPRMRQSYEDPTEHDGGLALQALAECADELAAALNTERAK